MRKIRFATGMGADGFFTSEAMQLLLRLGLVCPDSDQARAERAANGFRRAFPQQSAYHSVTAHQSQFIKRIFAVIGPAVLIWPQISLMMFGASALVTFTMILLWRICLALTGWRQRNIAPAGEEPNGWPIYTLLIALHDEAETAPQLAKAIRALDYPQHQLDVKLLIEAGDTITARALDAQDWPIGTELHVLPPGLPRTKPRALNYGLATALGEFVVVYDAEDRPDPQQLKAAVRAFRAGDETLACVQAPLVGQGGPGGWISGQWGLEYAIQFGLILPALARLDLPIALGGTSNHFRRTVLEEAGGWDAWNVTEDADLGLRLARRGNKVGVIAPPTLEAPPAKLRVWIGQRSRWLKGFLQTWLVLMRTPRRTVKEMSVGGFISTQLTLGAAILSALAHGPWAVWCLICALLSGVTLGALGQSLFVLTYVSGAGIALMAPGRKDFRRLFYALTLPIYWPLQSAAMIRALYGLWNCPHFWAKTPHTSNYRKPTPTCSTLYSPVPDLPSAAP